MPRFVLIDHSLRSVGGHHYEYAVHVLREAETAGFAIVLATHRSFQDRSHLPATWQVLPVFPYHTYSPYAFATESRRPQTVGTGGASTVAPSRTTRSGSWLFRSLLAPRLDWYRRRDRQRRLKCFVSACHELFVKVAIEPGDVVLVPTLSPFDLQGLASYLASAPHTMQATWHLQFQFDLLDPPATRRTDQQQRLVSLRRQCRAARQLIPHHDISLYATTSRLATQYQQLGIGEVRELPYPVNPGLHTQQQAPSPARPLRITCAGGMRREQGSHQLAMVIRDLWLPYLAAGRGQLQIQASRWRFHRLLSRVKGRLRREVARSVRKPDGQAGLVRIEQPLPMDAYQQLIRDTNIGLLLYNRDSYYARCSGVLVEMLAAGVPVIVPAASWLADQLAEPTFRYHDQLQREAELVDRMHLRATASQPTGPDGPARTLTAEIAIPPRVTGIITHFRHNRRSPDAYVCLRTEHLDATGRLVDTRCSTVGIRAGGKPASTLAPIRGRTSRVLMTWSNVDDGELPDVKDIEVSFLAAVAVDPRPRHPYPTGAVGLTASSGEQVPRLLGEMIEHYEHYRKTALAFSSEWMTEHSPRNVLRTILARHDEQKSGAVTTDAA